MGDKAFAGCRDFECGSGWNSAVNDYEYGFILINVAFDYFSEFFWAAAWKANLQGFNFGWNVFFDLLYCFHFFHV